MSRPTNTPGVPCPIPACIQTGPHDRHVTATGATFTWTVVHTSVGPLDLAARLLGAGVQAMPDPLPEGLTIVDDPTDKRKGSAFARALRIESLDWSRFTVSPFVDQGDGTVKATVTGLLDFPAVAPQGGPDPRNTDTNKDE